MRRFKITIKHNPGTIWDKLNDPNTTWAVWDCAKDKLVKICADRDAALALANKLEKAA